MLEFLAILLLIPFGFLAYKNISQALAAVIFLLPSYLWRLDFFGLPSTFLELLILVLFVIFLLKDQRWKNINFTTKNSTTNILNKTERYLLVSWLGVSLLALLINFNLAALGLWRAYFLEPIMFFLVFIYSIKNKKDLNLIFLAFVYLLIALGLVSLMQYFTNWNLPAAYNLPNPKRLTALFSYPNALALLVAPISIFLLLLAKTKQIKKEQILYCLAAILGFLSLLASRSEGAILAVCLVLFIFIFFKLKKSAHRAGLLAISFFILFFSPLKTYFFQIFRDLFRPEASHFTSSLAVRGLQWQESLIMLKDHWLWGAGINGYQSLMASYHQITWLEIFLYPHNIFLNFWTELGLLGLIIFLLLLVYITKSIFNLLITKNNLAWPLAAAFLVIIIHGLVDVPYFKNDLSILFFTFFALLVLVNKNKIQNVN